MEKLIFLALSISIIGGLVGIVYQAISQAVDRRKYPPQGELIDIGGFRLMSTVLGKEHPQL